MAVLDALNPLDLSNFVAYVLIWTVCFIVAFAQYSKSGFYYRRYLYETLFKINEIAQGTVNTARLRIRLRKGVYNPVEGAYGWILYHLHLVGHIFHFIMAAFLFVGLALWLTQLWGHIMAPAPMSVYGSLTWIYVTYFLYLFVNLVDNFAISWYSSLELWARVAGIAILLVNFVLSLVTIALFWFFVFSYNSTQMAWAGGLLSVWTLFYFIKVVIEVIIFIALRNLPGHGKFFSGMHERE